MTQDTAALREKIARIVNPPAWAELDEHEQYPAARARQSEWRALSLEKADAILALLPSPQSIRRAAMEEAAKVAEASIPGFESNFPDIAHDVKVATERAMLIAERIRALIKSGVVVEKT